MKTYNVVAVYKTRLGKRGDGGDWDTDTATIHAILGRSVTACGRIPPIDIDGRWERMTSGHVNCKRCLAKISKMEQQEAGR